MPSKKVPDPHSVPPNAGLKNLMFFFDGMLALDQQRVNDGNGPPAARLASLLALDRRRHYDEIVHDNVGQPPLGAGTVPYLDVHHMIVAAGNEPLTEIDAAKPDDVMLAQWPLATTSPPYGVLPSLGFAGMMNTGQQSRATAIERPPHGQRFGCPVAYGI